MPTDRAMEGSIYPGDPARGKLRPMRLLMAAGLALATACGGDDPPLSPEQLLAELEELPNVHDVTKMDTSTAGYTYYVIRFEQPVDHNDPQSPTFLQKVSLLHRDEELPMIGVTTGYWDYYNDRVAEVTGLLGANQISVEHRYFAESRPEPADWSKLTIEQMAHDQHAIVSSLKRIYEGSFLTTGASKGGMTAIYYRRFYPDDVDGTVPYVAPISFGAPDARYAPFLDTLGPADCRQKIRDVATEMLANRRSAFLTRAQAQATTNNFAYTRIELAPAVESSIFNLEWSFWQYYGVTVCPDVPAPTASDDELWSFLDDISPVSDNTDARIGQFDAYYYQAYFQLGYPDGGATYLDPYLQFTDADYLDALPAPQPPYDGGAAMTDIDQFVREDGERLLFIYGEWDPWTGGQFELGAAKDSVRLLQAEGTHGARITRLADADRETAFAKLEAWTGITPRLPMARSTHEVKPPRVPPAMTRALRARSVAP
jgi:hypothetical protein